MTQPPPSGSDPWAEATDPPTGDAGGSPRELWAEVGRHLQDLGRAVRAHLEPESPDAATWSPPPDDPAGRAAGPAGAPTGDPAGASTGEPTGAPAGASTGASTGDPTGGSTGGPTGASTGGPTGPAGGRDDRGRDDWRDDRWADARFVARRLGRTAQQLAAQAGDAVRDPAVRESAQQAARSLGDALSRTAEDFGAQLRQNARSPRWSDPTRPRPEPEPPVAPRRPDDPEPGRD